jgi:hypothetical protein
MAFKPIGELQLGQFLQIAFTQGVFNQLNQTFPDFEMVKKFRVADPNWREQRFMLQTSLGPSAVQYRNPSFSTAFPAAQRIGISEKTAVAKELDATVEIEYNLYKKALNSPLKYAEPLALEMQSKAIAAKRRIAADLYGDGTGVVGQVKTRAVVAGDPGRLELELDDASSARGHIGFCEFDDLLVVHAPDSSAHNPEVASGTVAALRIVSRSRKSNKIVVEAIDAAGNVLDVDSVGTVAAGDFLFRAGQETVPNLSGAVGDYGLITEVFPGLESLLADDGRVVHGISMSGATAGTVVDGGGSGGLSLALVQEALSNAKIAVGQGRYKWSMLVASPEQRDALIESAETDRRFMVADNPKRGGKSFVFQHENDTLEVIASEYCPKQRAFALPNQSAGGQSMMQLYFTEMAPVDVGSGKLHLKPASGGGHERKIASYMEGYISLLCTHPAAGVVIKNF